MEEYIMTIDEGTTSARAVIFNKNSEIVAMCAKERDGASAVAKSALAPHSK